MKVCYWGTYDTDYPRNRTVIASLRRAGLEVAELNEPLWKNSKDKLARASAWWKSPGFLLRWVSAYVKLACRLFREPGVDILFVGYTGHFDMFFAKPLAMLKGIPVVFDTFLSLYETFVEDRGVIKPGSLKAWLLHFADKYSCALADLALLDTEEHIEYFRTQFGLPAAGFRRSFVGANEELYKAGPAMAAEAPFTVLYFGTYIPLHGIPHILRAAKQLETSGIRFRFVGIGADYAASRKLAEDLELRNTEFVPFAGMHTPPEELSNASVCLGVFGGSGKASRVIPNKIFQALAMARPVITGDSPAARELLRDGRDCIFCRMADPASLAAAILRLRADPVLGQEIAAGGYRTFKSRASVEALGADLAAALTGLTGKA